MSTTEQDAAETQDDDTYSTPIQSVNESLSVTERFTDNAIHNILPARYLNRDDNGDVVEDPEDIFARVAENVAQAEFKVTNDSEAVTTERYETWQAEFQELMEQQLFMPNSPCLMNAGATLQQLSACFVVEPKDDMESIFESSKQAALIFKSGGGVGYSFSHLRPQGTVVSSTGGVSSGPISFMEVFNTTCGTVEQGGMRRGAQMGILRIDHADIGRFICAKRREGDFDNFNISVGATDEFKEAVEQNGLYTFYSPQTDYEEPFDVVEETADFYNYEYRNNPEDWEDAEQDGVSGKLVRENFWRDYADTVEVWDPEADERVPIEEKWADSFDEGGEYELQEGEEMKLPARFIFDIIIDGAWRNGEPGIVHLDETNREHSFDTEEYPSKHKIRATNPCAEQPLSNFEACNLGHINLSLMMRDDSQTLGQWRDENDTSGLSLDEVVQRYCEDAIDYEQFDRVITAGTRFLDNVVTQSKFPLEEIEKRVDGQRKIGLGLMGFAQMLMQMGVPYGSDESMQVARSVMRYIDWQSKQVSHSLAMERGNFDYWNESKYSDPTSYPEWFEDHVYEDPEDWENGYPIRNHNTTTIAPTGTTSMLADTTGGCEPAFNVVNYKNVGDDVQGDDMLVEFDDYFAQTLEANGFDPEEVKQEAIDLMATNDFEGPHDLSIPEGLADIFVTTNDLSSIQHADMQRAFQEFTDSGISKTINAPNDATRADVYTAFMRSLDDSEDSLGKPAKGLTFYRDGSRDEQVLTVRRDNNLDKEDADDEDVLTEAQLLLLEEGQDDIAKAIGAMLRDSDGMSEEYCEKCGEKIQEEDETASCYICPNPDCMHSPCA